MTGSGIGTRLPGFVAVPAGPGLLPVAAQLADAVGDRRVAQVGGPGRRLRLADAPAHVEPGEVAHLVRPHRQAEVVHDAVDLLGQRALLEEEVRLAAVGVEHAVADEAVADADQHADLAEGLRQPHDGGDGLARGPGAAHVLHQRMTLAGLKKWVPMTCSPAATWRRRWRRRRGSRCWWRGSRRACTRRRASRRPPS